MTDATSNPPRVLVIDDDADLRDVMKLALQDEGYRVIVAANGEVALREIEAARPALVLLDMRMPVMDGPAFLKRCRAIPGARIPIILFTAGGETDVIEGMDADGLLSKPFDLNVLLATVSKWVSVPK